MSNDRLADIVEKQSETSCRVRITFLNCFKSVSVYVIAMVSVFLFKSYTFLNFRNENRNYVGKFL